MSSEVGQTELERKYDLIEMRRAKVLRLLASGLNQTEVADSLGVCKSTISIDVKQMKLEAKEGVREYIEDILPFEHKKTIAAFDEIIRQAWLAAGQHKEDPRVILQALNVISDAVMKRQQVLGDPQYLEKAIRKVAEIKKILEVQKNQTAPVVAPDDKAATDKTENAALEPKQETTDDDDPVIGIVIKEEDTTAP